jgi:hypothetical protein
MTDISSESDARTVNNTFRHQYRVLSEHEKRIMVLIKDQGVAFDALISSSVPKGREASIAKTKIEEAVMWSIKGLTA